MESVELISERLRYIREHYAKNISLARRGLVWSIWFTRIEEHTCRRSTAND